MPDSKPVDRGSNPRGPAYEKPPSFGWFFICGPTELIVLLTYRGESWNDASLRAASQVRNGVGLISHDSFRILGNGMDQSDR